MRSRWEGEPAGDPDGPVTITERDLRSLRRGARAGVLAIWLAILAVLATGWGLLMGSDALAGNEGVHRMRERVLSAMGQPSTPAEPAPSQAAPPNAAAGPPVAGGTDTLNVQRAGQ